MTLPEAECLKQHMFTWEQFCSESLMPLLVSISHRQGCGSGSLRTVSLFLPFLLDWDLPMFFGSSFPPSSSCLGARNHVLKAKFFSLKSSSLIPLLCLFCLWMIFWKIFTWLRVFLACMWMLHVCTVTTETRRRHWILWNCSYRWWWTIMWVLRTKPKSLAKATSAPT